MVSEKSTSCSGKKIINYNGK